MTGLTSPSASLRAWVSHGTPTPLKLNLTTLSLSCHCASRSWTRSWSTSPGICGCTSVLATSLRKMLLVKLALRLCPIRSTQLISRMLKGTWVCQSLYSLISHKNCQSRDFSVIFRTPLCWGTLVSHSVIVCSRCRRFKKVSPVSKSTKLNFRKS